MLLSPKSCLLVACLIAVAFYSCTAIIYSPESEGFGVFLAFHPQPGWSWSLDPHVLSYTERARLVILASSDWEQAMPWWASAYALGMLAGFACWATLIVLVLRSFYIAQTTA